jgi:Rap1a immunity proteins
MRRLLLSTAVFLWGICSGSSAEITVEQLHGFCTSPNGSEGQTACAAYLMGVVHGLQLGTSSTKQGKPFCIPADITTPQAILLFNKWVTEAPPTRPAAANFWAAILLSAFPCPPSKATAQTPSKDELANIPEGLKRAWDKASGDWNGELGRKAKETCNRKLGITVPVNTMQDVLRYYDLKKAEDWGDCVVNGMYPVPAPKRNPPAN